MNLPDQTKAVVDGLSLGTIFLTLLDKMPSIAALAAFIWTLIRIYETHTVRNLIKKISEWTE